MTKNLTNQSDLNPEQAKNAFRFILIILISSGFSAIYYSLTDLLAGVPLDLNSPNISFGILFLISFYSLWLLRKGQGVTSVTVLLVSFLITLIILASRLGGLDIVFVVVAVIVTFGTSSITIPRKEMMIMIFLSIIVSLYFVFLFVFDPFERESVIDDTVTWILTAAIILGYFTLIFRRYNTYPLRTKLTISFIFLIGVGVSVAFIFSNFNTRRILQENAEQRLLSDAKASASEIDFYLNYRIESISITAPYLDLRSYILLSPENRFTSPIKAKALGSLYSLANRDLDVLSYGLLDLEGNNIADSNNQYIGHNEAEQDYFQRAKDANTTFVSPIHYLPDEDEGFFFISSPVRDDMGNTIGILRAQYRASLLQELLSNKENISGEETFSVLFDSNHIVLAHGLNPELRGKIAFSANEENIAKLRENLLLPSNLPNEELSLNLEAVENGLSNFATTPYFSSEETAVGFAIIGAVTQLETVPWLIVSAQPEEVFLAPVQRQGRRALLAALMLILFAGFSALIVARIIAAPISQLQSTAQLFSEGDLTAQAAVNTDDEIGELAETFNKLTTQLRGTVETLETRIDERTKDLEARTNYLEGAAEISRIIGSIMDPDELVSQVVNLIKERFNLYYAGIFLLDEKGEWAILKAGTGEAGKNMLNRNHKIAVGEGMIGWCLENVEARIALDVGEDAVRFENPDLPDTRTEGALPLRSRGRVLGALTVQSTEEAAFDEAILTTMQSMTDQISIALDNAELFVKAEKALVAERKAYGVLSQRSWQEITQSRTLPRFMVKEDGKTSIMENTEELAEAPKSKLLQDDGLTAIIPIKNREYVLGGIKIRKSKKDGPWTKEQLEMTETISEQLSVALESARLFDQAQRKANREAIISDISTRIGASIRMDTIIQTAVKELGEALGSSEVSFRLTTSETETQDKE